MSVYFYITSIATSICLFIITVMEMFADEESYIFRMFGDTEILAILGVSIVLFILGFITDCKERKENE